MIAFHFIANPSIGTGHARRSSVLAHALVQAGEEVCLFTDRETIEFSRAFMPYSCDFVQMGKDTDTLVDAVTAKPLDTLVIDRYDVAPEYEAKLADQVRRLMVIDDFIDRPHYCDILLDQNIGRENAPRHNLSNPNTLILAGPKYALLRPEFRQLRKSLSVCPASPPRILICFGGLDSTGVTYEVSRILLSKFVGKAEFDIVAGSGTKHLDRLEALTNTHSGTNLHINSDDIAGLMANATLSIGAPGSMSLERCCLSLPSILVSVADNQIETGQKSEQSGIGIYLGDFQQLDTGIVCTELSKLLEDQERLPEMAKRAGEMTDGLGAERVVQALITSPSRTTI